MEKTLLEVSSDSDLNKIFAKAHYLEEAENSLKEGSLQFLVLEKIDKKEADKVAAAIKASRDQIKKLEDYIKGLSQKGFDSGKIPSVVKMIKDLGDALDRAQGDIAKINFDSGKMSSFMGSKLTAPGIAKAAIAIQSKANQFLTGFTDALQNIEDNLAPLAKDEKTKTSPMRDIAGTGGIPSEADLEKGIKGAMARALKPKGVFAKIGSFLAKKMPGAKGKILKSIPELDVDSASQELTDAILDASLSIFDAADIPDTKVPSEGLGAIAKDADEAEAKTGGGAGGGKEAGGASDIDSLIAQIKKAMIKKNPEVEQQFKDAGPEAVAAALKDDAEDVLKGKDVEAAAEEAQEEGISGVKWSEITSAFVDGSEDKDAAQKVVDALKGDKSFQDAVAGRINLEEGFFSGNLSSLLFEDVPFDVITKAAEKGSDEAPVQDKLARSMADALETADIEVTGIPAEEKEASGPKPEPGEIFKYTTNKGKELEVKIEKVFDDGDVFAMRPDGKGGFKKPPFRFPASKLGDKVEGSADEAGTAAADAPPPAPEKEAKEEQASAEKELQTAVKEEEKDPQSPKDAAMGALDSWVGSLSKTSQSELNASNRLGDLKDVIGMALDDSAKAVEGEVAAAIKAWRDDHEEQLVKNNRFAKKNFDQLEKLISQLAASMLKKANESRFGLTRENVRKIVFEYLNRKFYKNSDRILAEGEISQVEKDLIVYRMNKLAGLE